MFGWFKKKKEDDMLKSIEIRMTGPICACQEANLKWRFEAILSVLFMEVICNSCGAKLSTPANKVKANVLFEKGYPNQYKNQGPEARVLNLVPPDPQKH